MAKNKKKDQMTFALQRIAEDAEVQEQLRTAALRVHEAYARARKRPNSKAVQDKKIYDKVREAAASLTEAAGKLRPEPEPPKHRGRKAAVVMVTIGGAAYAVKQRRARSQNPQPAT